jgi:hypothetical protein
VHSQTRSSGSTDLADRVKSIIESRGLNLRAVSQATETRFGHGAPQFLPHNFYYELNLGTFSPSLHQVFALSSISNYRFFDWLRVFGLDVEQIPRLQILLPTKRTILLDSSLNDPSAWVRWMRNQSDQIPAAAMAPLSQLLQLGPNIRQGNLLKESRFLYAKIGREDAFAFPELLPGSIVRIDPTLVNVGDGTGSRRLMMVEHSKGICCCRLLAGAGRKITLVSTQLPYAQIQLKLHQEARILGTVDLEIRAFAHPEKAEVAGELAKRWKPEPLSSAVPKLNRFLRSARAKAGVSLREASQLSREIANLFHDDRYFLSASSLSDYEAGDTVPKHFQKAVSLCLSYAISFRTFLRAMDIPDESAETNPIPDRFIPRREPDDNDPGIHPLEPEGFLGELMRQIKDVPLFLRHAINDLSGLPSASLRTVFWVGGIKYPFHSYLTRALLVSVDRHKKLPIDSRRRPPWNQLFYVVLKRDGSYLVGPCGIENGTLVMYPDAEHLNLREEFRNHQDAEVIGQVCAVVRRL